jgi:6-phosphogluconate dehydrogenase
MQLGMIGLGKTGAIMVNRHISGGHGCVGFDVNSDGVENLKK